MSEDVSHLEACNRKNNETPALLVHVQDEDKLVDPAYNLRLLSRATKATTTQPYQIQVLVLPSEADNSLRLQFYCHIRFKSSFLPVKLPFLCISETFLVFQVSATAWQVTDQSSSANSTDSVNWPQEC